MWRLKRDWGDDSTSQLSLTIVCKPPEARGEAWNRSFLTALRRNQLCPQLISDFWPPKLADNKFLLFKPATLWYFVTLANWYKNWGQGTCILAPTRISWATILNPVLHSISSSMNCHQDPINSVHISVTYYVPGPGNSEVNKLRGGPWRNHSGGTTVWIGCDLKSSKR